MTDASFSLPSRLRRATGCVLLILPLLAVTPVGEAAETPVPSEPLEVVETVAVPKQAVKLDIYKQRFEVTANVQCRVPKKGPSMCMVDIGSEIAYQIEPEMILKYTSIRLDEQEFAAEISPQGTIQFRTSKVNYSGPQTFDVEVIYLK